MSGRGTALFVEWNCSLSGFPPLQPGRAETQAPPLAKASAATKMCCRFVVPDGSSARTCVSIQKRDARRSLGGDWMLSESPQGEGSEGVKCLYCMNAAGTGVSTCL